jgi:hypothetical protein
LRCTVPSINQPSGTRETYERQPSPGVTLIGPQLRLLTTQVLPDGPDSPRPLLLCPVAASSTLQQIGHGWPASGAQEVVRALDVCR